MPNNRYNWAELKRKYLVGKYKSVREFAKKQGMTYNAHFAKCTKGWADEKSAKNQQKESKIEEKITAAQIEQEVDRNTRHLHAWDAFLGFFEGQTAETLRAIAANPLTGLEAIERMAKILERTQKGQRLAEGLDKEDRSSNEARLAEALDKMAEAFSDE